MVSDCQIAFECLWQSSFCEYEKRTTTYWLNDSRSRTLVHTSISQFLPSADPGALPPYSTSPAPSPWCLLCRSCVAPSAPHQAGSWGMAGWISQSEAIHQGVFAQRHSQPVVRQEFVVRPQVGFTQGSAVTIQQFVEGDVPKSGDGCGDNGANRWSKHHHAPWRARRRMGCLHRSLQHGIHRTASHRARKHHIAITVHAVTQKTPTRMILVQHCSCFNLVVLKIHSVQRFHLILLEFCQGEPGIHKDLPQLGPTKETSIYNLVLPFTCSPQDRIVHGTSGQEETSSGWISVTTTYSNLMSIIQIELGRGIVIVCKCIIFAVVHIFSGFACWDTVSCAHEVQKSRLTQHFVDFLKLLLDLVQGSCIQGFGLFQRHIFQR